MALGINQVAALAGSFMGLSAFQAELEAKADRDTAALAALTGV